MKKEMKKALLNMCDQLFESAKQNIYEELAFELGEFDAGKVRQESDYITRLRGIRETLDDDECETELGDIDLSFLRGDFDRKEMGKLIPDKDIQEEIWDAIQDKTR